jgi:RimJ/RimL family protein N-acetyltransferase
MADLRDDVVAETERLILRRERPGDLEVWLEHMNTPQVMEKVGGVQTAAKVAQSFATMAAAEAKGEPAFLLVALKADGTLVGKCGLAPIETEAAPAALRGQQQIGWTLRQDHWGRGYATEAAAIMLAMAFERFGLATVFSQTSERNRGSWRVMQRLGMSRLAELDYHDPDYPPEDNPTMVWGITRAAWQALRLQAAADA